ncbi:MAG: phage/plasmid primase, P4 family [Alphaproteobacteria bacterium]
MTDATTTDRKGPSAIAELRARRMRAEPHIKRRKSPPPPEDQAGEAGETQHDGRGQAAADAAPLLVPNDPMPSARRFIARRYIVGEMRTLHHRGGVFYAWNGACYLQLEEAAVKAALYEFLEASVRWCDKTARLVPFQPNRTKVLDLLDALRAVTNLDGKIAVPCWLDGTPDLPPIDILPCANGLLHLPSRDLLPSTPAFFCDNALEFAFDASAREPAAWLAFLNSLWPEDPDAISVLQETFGYLLTPDTRQQKIFMLIGPKRSGKGTIARVLTALLGAANVCGPTLSSLERNFGMAPLIGKTAAIIADARLSGRADQAAITERLLSISGEDGLTIDRKHLPAWTGRLQTRLVILTNELPRLADTSGALAGRFIALTMSRSFYGREDHGLTDRLLDELPAILNWAIDGWERLRARGRFEQPASSVEAMEAMEDLSSPVGAFVREKCDVGSGLTVEIDRLFAAWCAWCRDQGRGDFHGSVQSFGRDLRACVTGLASRRPRDLANQGDRQRMYVGITLRDQPDQLPWVAE